MVKPNRTCRARAGVLPWATSSRFVRSKSTLSARSPGKTRVPRLSHQHAIEHSADDHFKVLVSNVHALGTIHLLDLIEQV